MCQLDESKAFILSTSSTMCKFVTWSLRNIHCELLVLDDTQLGQRNGSELWSKPDDLIELYVKSFKEG